MANPQTRPASTSNWLAGVAFEQPFRIDELLARVAEVFHMRGLIAAGVLQTYSETPGCDGSNLRLKAIGATWELPIMQPRGHHSKGCRLDYGAMADASQWIEASLKENADIIILNRFGRAESEGNGLRNVLQRCAEDERPTLIAVRADYLPAWNEFHGGLGDVLEPNLESIIDWYDRLPRAAGRPTLAAQPMSELS